MKNEKKLVEAFKAFMERGVIPYLQDDHIIVNEWKFLSGILTLEPIDETQINFYLLMANKNAQKQTNPTKIGNQLSPNPNSNLKEQQQVKGGNREGERSIGSGQQKMNTKRILANMQSFQGLMIRNQEKLENIAKKEMNPSKGEGIVNNSVQNKKNT